MGTRKIRIPSVVQTPPKRAISTVPAHHDRPALGANRLHFPAPGLVADLETAFPPHQAVAAWAGLFGVFAIREVVAADELGAFL